jgi:oxygen-independent coproporphyrinogen III oxidase
VTRLESMLAGPVYAGYAYAYPHKTAYRPLRPPVPLRDAWSNERRDALFLYLHVPFCEMRCGFCNLFTQTQPKDGVAGAYLAALRRQAVRVRAALGDARFARVAVGGGTPTFLDAAQLDGLFDVAEYTLGADLHAVPVAVETSPATAEPGKLALLRDRGVTRVSIGVQSFVDAEVAAANRPQTAVQVEAALGRLRAAGFPTLNLDLIYGLPGQSVASWLTSVRAALRWRPEELYLYPLYARPLTALGRAAPDGDDLRPACYREARALLLDSGYVQLSMRMFRARHAPAEGGPVYCCQEDGMVGVGCGARSYTSGLHYATEYAVRAAGIREILADYVARPDEAFDRADYGFHLGPDEQRRRYVIQSLLCGEGLVSSAYRARFGTEALDDLPELSELEAAGLARRDPDRLILTPEGVERSDVLGPWLYSEAVWNLMGDFAWR